LTLLADLDKEEHSLARQAEGCCYWDGGLDI